MFFGRVSGSEFSDYVFDKCFVPGPTLHYVNIALPAATIQLTNRCAYIYIYYAYIYIYIIEGYTHIDVTCLHVVCVCVTYNNIL